MRKVLIALGVAPMIVGSAMAAQPLTDRQMDKIVAGDNFTVSLGAFFLNFTETLGGGTANFTTSLPSSNFSYVTDLSASLCGGPCVFIAH
ncbi:MAG TPA: hypothetical protein VLX09_20645 [Stellaceae bacterium]|nr:hypothetical protein [Stellaceae bacterium]